MALDVMLIPLGFAALVAWAFVEDRIQKRRAAIAAASDPPKPRNLAGVRRLARQQPLPKAAGELLERNTLVFVSASTLERRLDHRIEDADGVTLGWALQVPPPGKLASNGRPGRSAKVRVEISDADRHRVIQLLRPRGLLYTPEVSVLEPNGILVGSIWHLGRRRSALFDRFGCQLATIERTSDRYSVDHVIYSLAGIELGTISDYRHIAERTLLEPDEREMLQRMFGTPNGDQPDEHVLEVTAPAGRELRMLMLGAAAAVYLELQRPYTDDTD